MRPRVYISGPISHGDTIPEEYQGGNVRRAEDAARELMLAGFSVLCPHLMWYLQRNLPEDKKIPYGEWIENDLPWIADNQGSVQAMLRLSGSSEGADAECDHAELYGVPVYYDLDSLIQDKAGLERAADEPFYGILREMAEMYRRKAQDYGTDEDPLANVRAAGFWRTGLAGRRNPSER